MCKFGYLCTRVCVHACTCVPCVRECVRACMREHVRACVCNKSNCPHVTLRPSGSEALGVLHVAFASVSPSLAVFSMLPGHFIVGGLLVTYTIVGGSSGLHTQNVIGAKAACHVPEMQDND